MRAEDLIGLIGEESPQERTLLLHAIADAYLDCGQVLLGECWREVAARGWWPFRNNERQVLWHWRKALAEHELHLKGAPRAVLPEEISSRLSQPWKHFAYFACHGFHHPKEALLDLVRALCAKAKDSSTPSPTTAQTSPSC